MAMASPRKPRFPPNTPKPPNMAHEELVELVAEGKDDLMEEFFEKGTLPEEHIVSGLDEEMREMRVFPIVCMSGPHNIGSDMLLESDRRSLSLARSIAPPSS